MIKRIAHLNLEETKQWMASDLYHQVCSDYYFTEKSLEYNREYFGSDYHDYSIIYFDKAIPILAIYAIFKGQVFEYYTWPVTIHVLRVASADARNDAYKNAVAYIESTAKNRGIQQLRYYSNSYFDGSLIHKITASKVQYHSIIDLELTVQAIKSNVRRRYKSFINWGEKNLTTIIVNQDNPDRNKFLDYKNFHFETSGRKTRSDRSWEIQFEMIQNGTAYLTLCYLGQKLVSGNLCLHGHLTAFYGVGVNDRALMAENIPVGHYPIFASIIHAKKIGLRLFNMNKVEFDRADIKLNQLAVFKSGFTASLPSVIAHTVNFSESNES
jgi:hypothetical protein